MAAEGGAASSSRGAGMRSRSGGGGGIGGEIVEVQGGRIVRSTGRKDRHSKVCTAKGPRDRRVRLSAHTAIQFYDVQDRLGYDRPSKAVDWLIKKAKAAIDQLDHLPPWNPAAAATKLASVSASAPASEMADGGGLLPPSLDSDAIADTIKSFFPVAVAAGEEEEEEEEEVQEQQQPNHSHSQSHFQCHPPPPQFHDYQPNQSQQDLRLSLQSFQEDPILLHHQHHQNQGDQALFSGTAPPMGFGWAEHHPSQRIVFGGGGGGGGGNDGGGFVFNSLQHQQAGEAAAAIMQPLFGRGGDNIHQLFFPSSSSTSSQRGPLQSSNTPSVRASWIESPSMADHQILHAIHHQHLHHHQASMPAGIGIGMGMAFGGGFSGFHPIPARIEGEEEHNGGAAGISGDNPSSASSDSRH